MEKGKTNLSVLKTLEDRANFFPYSQKEKAVFSKSDFTKEARINAKKTNIHLFCFREMIEIGRKCFS